jgi:hypothetical protein
MMVVLHFGSGLARAGTVNRTINGLATFAILVGCALQASAAVLYMGPLLILQDGAGLDAFSVAQRQGLAVAAINLSRQAFDVYLIFFGFWCVLTGYLIFKSTFLPRILGVLLALDGLGWMTYLWPPPGGLDLSGHRRGSSLRGVPAAVLAAHLRCRQPPLVGAGGHRRSLAA